MGRSFKDVSIKRKLRVIMLLTTAISLVLAGFAFWAYQFVEARSDLKLSLTSSASIVASAAAGAIESGDKPKAAEILADLRKDERVIAAAIFDRNGALLASTGTATFSARRLPTIQKALFEFGGNELKFSYPIVRDGKALGWLSLRASTEQTVAKLERYVLISIAVLASSLLFAFLFSAGMQMAISEPVLRLANTANAVTLGGNYKTRAEKYGDDEIGKLVDAFNAMLGQIDSRDAELRKHRDNLEHEVEKRTLDLRVLNEELIIARDRAEEVARLKSEFLANVSHEIRTPMNGVMGMAELALQTNLTGEQREYLSTVKTSADSLLAVINEILDFSKIEAGKVELEIAPFNLHESVNETMRMLSASAHRKGLELLCDINPEVPQAVRGDCGRLRQVLVNLLGNAIKFTDSGEVLLTIDVLNRTDDAVELSFSVIDTGMGVPEDRRANIFEAFVQLDGSMTRRHGGTGLGLAICSKLVRLMGGRIRVDGRRDCRGSVFAFTVRVMPEPQEIGRPRPAQKSALAGLRVLVVDDNATSRRLLEEMLHGCGAAPETAASGPLGLEELLRANREGQPFGVVLLDVAMPGMSGTDTARRICAEPSLDGTPLVLLSSTGAVEPDNRGLGTKVFRQVMKPVSRPALIQALLDVTGKTAESVRRNTSLSADGGDAPMRILVAEDNTVNQMVIRKLLERAGHSVTIAKNGAEAVEMHAGSVYDLVFMDIQMPIMNGHDATRAIRAAEQISGRRTPVVALTAHAMKGDRDLCLAVGMDDYVTKPLNTDQLKAILHRFASQEVVRS